MSTVHVSARLPSDLVDRVRALAERSDRSFTATVRRALESAIERAAIDERVAAMSDEEIERMMLGDQAGGVDA